MLFRNINTRIDVFLVCNLLIDLQICVPHLKNLYILCTCFIISFTLVLFIVKPKKIGKPKTYNIKNK